MENLDLISVWSEVKNASTPMIYMRNTENTIASLCRSMGKSNALFEIEEGSCSNLNFSNNVLHPGQDETILAKSLADDHIFEDFPTEIKHSVSDGEEVKGLISHALKRGPLDVNIEITKRGSLKLCLLMLNESKQPEKVIIKYDGIIQEFLINWNEWGWAPITLLEEFNDDRKVNFEISSGEQNSMLEISKIYLLYQDIEFTD